MASSDAPLPRGLIGRRGTPTGKSTRLPSIRGPRDLTLGGVPKKVFTPNIPVRKDRPKDGSATPSTSRISQRSERYERGRGGARARGRGMFTTVQSHSSIFEQGPAERLIPRTARDIFYERKDPGSSSGSSSRVKKKKADPEEAKRVIDHLLCDDFIDDDDDDIKKKHEEEEVELRPIQLPLASLTAKYENKAELDAVDSVKIKVEPEDPDAEHNADVDMTDISKIPPTTTPVKPAPIKPITCQELFSFSTKSDREELLFFQLPDVIPGIPPSKDDDDPRLTDKKSRQDAASKSNSQTVKKEEKSITEKLGLCSMADFSEGHIGKLQIRKSGRVQLVLGNITLDLEMGTPCGFLQEVVSIKTDVDGGQMTVLGHVNNKVIATPDFDSLLGQT